MKNKLYLKQIVQQLEREYPNSAMVVGTESNEEDSPYVFVIIDDDHMYFGAQVPESENVKVKRLEIEKISRIFFVGAKLSIQLKNGLFEMVIHTQEEALRSLCKEFKSIKNKEITVPTGNIMDLDLQERVIPEPVYSHLRTDISPFGLQKQNLSNSGEHKGLAQAVKHSDIHDVIEATRLFSTSDPMVEAENEEENKPAYKTLEEMLKGESLDEPEVVDANTKDVVGDTTKEEYELESKKDILIPTGEHPVVKPEKPLSKKEKKALDKKRKKEEKEEEEYYKSGHPILVSLLILVLLFVGYLVVAYALKVNNIVTDLPLNNWVDEGVRAVLQLLGLSTN